LSDACLLLVLLSAPLAAGTVHPQSWGALFVLSAGAWLLALRGGARNTVSHPLLIAAIALTGLAVLLPLIPLPPAVLQVLSPHAADMWKQGVPTGQVEGSWHPLHRAPGPGLYAVLRWSTVVTFLLTCASRATEREWRDRARLWVMATGGLAAAVCIVQTTLDMDRVLGVYEPRWEQAHPLRSPLLLANHWAALQGAVFLLGCGELLRRSISFRSLVLVATTTAVAGMMLWMTDSRGGFLGTAAGLSVLLFLASSKHRHHSTSRGPRLLGYALAAVPLPTAVGWLWWRESGKTYVITGLPQPPFSAEPRLMWLPDILQLIREHSWTGVGVGGFLDAFMAFHTAAGERLAYQPESLFLKLLAENGLVVGGALVLLTLALTIVVLNSAYRRPHLAGAAAALFSLLIHEQTDFALHTGGVLIPAVLLLVVCMPSGDRQLSTRLHLALALCICTIAIGAASCSQHWDLERDLTAHGLHERDDPAELNNVAAELWGWHPSSFVLAQELARRFADAGYATEAMAWINRAMQLAPHHPYPHLMAARLLRSLGANDQALIEYRLTLESDWRHAGQPIYREVARNYPDLETLKRLAPRDEPDALSLFAQIALWEKDPRAAGLAQSAYEQRPEHPRAVSVQAQALVWQHRLREARALALDALQRLSLGQAIRAQLIVVLWQSGEQTMALDLLVRHLASTSGADPALYLRLADWHRLTKAPGLARVALRHARRDGGAQVVAHSLVREAILEQDQGAVAAALGLVRRAQAEYPEDSYAWVEEVRILLAQGDHALALEQARRNRRRLAQSPEGQALLSQLLPGNTTGPETAAPQPSSEMSGDAQ
jgi:hypothetical protein